ncbi:hypothetical protein [Rhizobium sp. BR 362]|uniref:hypothetical protein n=1 Tax=Rhizobium sp. BR 362 TaxID=3040670 RepID=UPI002F42E0F3
MGVVQALKSAVAEARSLGRDVPPVIEELLHLIAETIDPPAPDAVVEETKPEAAEEPQPASEPAAVDPDAPQQEAPAPEPVPSEPDPAPQQ